MEYLGENLGGVRVLGPFIHIRGCSPKKQVKNKGTLPGKYSRQFLGVSQLIYVFDVT